MAENDDSDAIVVTARRRDELLQDVPLTVNAVTGQQIEDLNLQRFEDIETLVPGLAMTEAQFATRVNLRGVNFDTNISGNNATVEFYLNEAPVQSIYVLQSMWDTGQVEVLRGPQGTLRGRAAPSGSITVATRRPDLQDYGGYLRGSVSDLDNRAAEGAVNIPLIEDVLAIRFSGRVDQNVGAGIESLNNREEHGTRTRGGRFSILFEPMDDLSFNYTHQRVDTARTDYQAIESLNIVDSSAPASPRTIRAEDRQSLAFDPRMTDQEFTIDILNGQYHFAGQALYFTAASEHLQLELWGGAGDPTNLFDPNVYTGAAGAIRTSGGGQDTKQQTDAYEIRLQSDEPLFGFVDYVIGALHKRDKPPSSLDSASFIWFGAPAPATGAFINHTPVARLSETQEDSVFANLNFHIGDRAEISIGGRHIEYEDHGNTLVNNVVQTGFPRHLEFEADIFQASAKFNITDDFMIYASGGEAWRPGTFAVGVFGLNQSTLLRSLEETQPEESTSYEIGFKSEWFDGQFRFNMATYYQEFENYPRRTPEAIFFLTESSSNPGVVDRTSFNLVTGVPLEVTGVEAEFGWEITDNWNLTGNVAWTDSQTGPSTIPCNDFVGGVSDGIPDVVTTSPSVADLVAAGYAVAGYAGFLAGPQVRTCNLSGEDSTSGPPWSVTLVSEYRHGLWSGMEGYVRGQLLAYDEDPRTTTSALDDIESYAILNLFAGITSEDGAWDLMFFARNVTDEQQFARGNSPLAVNYRIGATPSFTNSTYRSVTPVTPLQEFGVNLRYNF